MGAILIPEPDHHPLLQIVQKERNKGNKRDWFKMRGIF
jgi:hypothetical protein